MLTSALVAIGEARVDIHATVGVVFIAEASLAHLRRVKAVCIFDPQSLCQVPQYCAREIVQPLVNAVGQVVEYSIETWYPIDDAAQPPERVVTRAARVAGLVRRRDLYEILPDLRGVELSGSNKSVFSVPRVVRDCTLAMSLQTDRNPIIIISGARGRPRSK